MHLFHNYHGREENLAKKFKNLVHIFSIAKRIKIDQNDTIRPEKSAIFESVTIKSEEQVLK